MLLEVRAVGRKTPRDGRLEIGEAVARRLGSIDGLQGQVGEAVASATLERMACGKCADAGPGHDHHFLVCDLFRALVPGEHCAIVWHADRRTVEVSPPHPL